MNIKYLIIILIVLAWTKGISQNKNRDVIDTPLSIFIETEKRFTGGEINDKSVYSLSEDFEIISFIRKDNNIPNLDLIVRYVFSKTDSLVKVIRYELDIVNFDKTNRKQDKQFRKALATHYLNIEKSLTDELGNGSISGELTEKTPIDEKEYFYKTNCWTIGETRIDLLIEMSNSYGLKKLTEKPIHKVQITYSASMNNKAKTEYIGRKN